MPAEYLKLSQPGTVYLFSASRMASGGTVIARIAVLVSVGSQSIKINREMLNIQLLQNMSCSTSCLRKLIYWEKKNNLEISIDVNILQLAAKPLVAQTSTRREGKSQAFVLVGGGGW